jgi:hypothetical protein
MEETPIQRYYPLFTYAADRGISTPTLRTYLDSQQVMIHRLHLQGCGVSDIDAITCEDGHRLSTMLDMIFEVKGEKPDDKPLGSFYLILPIPHETKSRIKLGFASHLEQRLKDFLTICPEAYVVDAWPCRQSWEQTAIQSATRVDCYCVEGEVFNCYNTDRDCLAGDYDNQAALKRLINRCKQFFLTMPTGDRESRLRAFVRTANLAPDRTLNHVAS